MFAKKILCAILVLAFTSFVTPSASWAKGSSSGKSSSKSSSSSHSVKGYTRKDGTYVQPHRQTNPNGTKNDNWSTRGNVNPDTGKPGTKKRD